MPATPVGSPTASPVHQAASVSSNSAQAQPSLKTGTLGGLRVSAINLAEKAAQENSKASLYVAGAALVVMGFVAAVAGVAATIATGGIAAAIALPAGFVAGAVFIGLGVLLISAGQKGGADAIDEDLESALEALKASADREALARTKPAERAVLKDVDQMAALISAETGQPADIHAAVLTRVQVSPQVVVRDDDGAVAGVILATPVQDAERDGDPFTQAALAAYPGSRNALISSSAYLRADHRIEGVANKLRTAQAEAYLGREILHFSPMSAKHHIASLATAGFTKVAEFDAPTGQRYVVTSNRAGLE